VYEGDHKSTLAVCDIRDFLRVSLALMLYKPFYREAVVWKRLRHPNVVPFLGVTTTQLQLISKWVPDDTLTDYADRIGLVGAPPHRMVN